MDINNRLFYISSYIYVSLYIKSNIIIPLLYSLFERIIDNEAFGSDKLKKHVGSFLVFLFLITSGSTFASVNKNNITNTSSIGMRRISGFKLLCVFLFLPFLTFAARSVDQNTELPSQFSGVVYVSNSTVIVGADQIHIVTEKNLSGKPIVTTVKPIVKPAAISKEAVEKQKKIKAEKFEKEFPPVKTQIFVHNSSDSSSLLAAKQMVNCQATISTTSPQKQVLNAAIADMVKSISIDAQLAKQKYYTSISYLLFGKYRSSSLRAPPYHI